MNDHVTKPIDPDALFVVLNRWTRSKPVNTALAIARNLPGSGETVLPDLAGVDTVGALKRVAGNKRLLRSLLNQFAKQQRNTTAQLSDALRNGDRPLCGRIAHTMKGVAGNLGISSVHLSAEQLENAIRENSADLPAIVEEFSSVLSRSIQDIENALAEAPSVGVPHTKSDPEAASTAAAKLMALLRANDAGAVEALAELEQAVGGSVENSRLDTLRQEITEYNFEAAIGVLAEIKEMCEICS